MKLQCKMKYEAEHVTSLIGVNPRVESAATKHDVGAEECADVTKQGSDERRSPVCLFLNPTHRY